MFLGVVLDRLYLFSVGTVFGYSRPELDFRQAVWVCRRIVFPVGNSVPVSYDNVLDGSPLSFTRGRRLGGRRGRVTISWSCHLVWVELDVSI
jgi:hypothetical protein